MNIYGRYPRDGVVDGKSIGSSNSACLEIVSPRDGQVIGEIPAGDDRDVDVAVLSARRAFEAGGWSREAPSVRKGRLLAFADLIERDAAQLDVIDALEMGKPIAAAGFNAASAAGLLRYYAEAIDKLHGKTMPSDATSLVVQTLIPRGVVVAITPWNFPTYNAVMKVAPALAAGNSVILKPSELSPTSAICLAHLAVEAGLPEGVLNVVNGLGQTVGSALGLHNDVDMVTFTGSTQVGKQILGYAGQSNMKVVIAECGGKSPQVVFDDGVDIAVASRAIAGSILFNQGQVCSAGSRLIVADSIADEVVGLVQAEIVKVRIGDPLDPNCDFGPIVSASQLQRIMRYVEKGQAEGAILHCGGEVVLTETGGSFIEPAILTCVEPQHIVARTEIFGPVLAVLRFRDFDEAVRLANATDYGLAAYCWTANLETGLKLGQVVRAGLNIVNCGKALTAGPGHAFSAEPFGLSGTGIEGGLCGLASFSRRQLTWYNF